MPRLTPISPKKLYRRLRKDFGFDIGPDAGGKHPTMTRSTDGKTITVPNEHSTDIRPELLSRLLTQWGISRDDWAA